MIWSTRVWQHLIGILAVVLCLSYPDSKFDIYRHNPRNSTPRERTCNSLNSLWTTGTNTKFCLYRRSLQSQRIVCFSPRPQRACRTSPKKRLPARQKQHCLQPGKSTILPSFTMISHEPPQRDYSPYSIGEQSPSTSASPL